MSSKMLVRVILSYMCVPRPPVGVVDDVSVAKESDERNDERTQLSVSLHSCLECRDSQERVKRYPCCCMVGLSLK